MKNVASALISLSFLMLTFGPVSAWQQDGVPVVVAPNQQFWSRMVSDGAGGVIIAWHDERSAPNVATIYVQRLSSAGEALWTENGVPLCPATGGNAYPAITSDGSGGAIIAWTDQRTSGFGDIYVQRVNPAGDPQWTIDGVALCTATNAQMWPQIVSDGAGGAIVTWEDYRFGSSNSSIYARRVDAAGTPLAGADGVGVCTAPNNQTNPTITSDGAGGAIVTWEDYRLGGTANIFVGRFDASGTLPWSFNGVEMCIAAEHQSAPRIVSDGAGGAIVTWIDWRDAVSSPDIYARRVNASGIAQWTVNGVALCSLPLVQREPAISPDGAGGAIVAWSDRRSTTDYDIYGQRVDAAGAAQWAMDGIPLCVAQNNQDVPVMAPDAAGGAIIAWQDQRTGVERYDIYALRVNGSGTTQWTASACADTLTQSTPSIAEDGAGGAFFSWWDSRLPDSNTNVYAQYIDGSGPFGSGIPGGEMIATLELGPGYPNPSAGTAMFDVRLETPSDLVVELFDLEGRRLGGRELRAVSAGLRQIMLDDLSADGGLLPSGVYLIRVRAAGREATRKLTIVR